MAQAEIRAGRAYIQLTAKDKLTKGLQNAKRKLMNFSKSVSELGNKLIKIGSVVGGALMATSAYFMKAGDSFDKMSGRTGASVEWLSQMAFAAQQSGASIQAVEDAVKQMNKRFGQALRGQGEMLKGLQMLGMTAKDLQGLSPQVMFEIIADQISMVKNEAQRTKIIDSMFGGGANKLQNLFGRIRGNIKSLREQARKLGLTISTEDAKKAAELADAWGRLVAMGKMFIYRVGGVLAPTLKRIADGVKMCVMQFNQFDQESKEIILTVAKSAVGIIALGVGLRATATIVKGFVYGFSGITKIFVGLYKASGLLATGIVKSFKGIAIAFKFIPTAISAIAVGIKVALGVILSPIGLIVTAVVGLGIAIAYHTGLISKAWEALKGFFISSNASMADSAKYLGQKINQFGAYCSESWQGVKDAFHGGDLKLAVKVLWASVKVAWLQGIQPLKETWIGFKSLLVEGWSNLWHGMADVFSACFYALKDGWSATVYWLLDAWNATVYGLTVAWYATVNGLTVAWNSVTSFLTEAWSATVNGIAKVWNRVMGTLMKAWVKLKGLFSDKVNVDVQVSRIDNEISAKNSALDDETASVVRRNQQKEREQKQRYEQQRNSARQQREMERKGIQDARNAERIKNQSDRRREKERLERQRQAEISGNLSMYADEIGQAKRAVEDAKKQRKALLDQAKRKAQQAEKAKKVKAEQQKEKVIRNIAQVKGSVKGSFYADAISGVRVNTDQKRTADGVQQLVAETKKTNDLLRKNSGNSNGGTLVFA